jgi:hypothetical protein
MLQLAHEIRDTTIRGMSERHPADAKILAHRDTRITNPATGDAIELA